MFQMTKFAFIGADIGFRFGQQLLDVNCGIVGAAATKPKDQQCHKDKFDPFVYLHRASFILAGQGTGLHHPSGDQMTKDRGQESVNIVSLPGHGRLFVFLFNYYLLL